MADWGDWLSGFAQMIPGGGGIKVAHDAYIQQNGRMPWDWGDPPSAPTQTPAPGAAAQNPAQAEADSLDQNAPSASAATDAPTYLGMPAGYDPHVDGYPVAHLGGKARQGTHLYSSGNEVTDWWDMTREEKIQAKAMLYKAGYYGSNVPEQSGRVVTAEDQKALAAAMGDANRSGWDSWQTAVSLKREASDSSGNSAQEAQMRQAFHASVTGLQQFAYQNGIRLPNDFIAQKSRQIANGQTSQDAVIGRLRENYVARAYPAFADQIKAGVSMREIAQPYLSSYAQILEVPDSQIDLNDPLLKKALQGVTDKGEPAQTPLWKFEQDLKKDPRWQNTDNAWNEIGQQAFDVMKMFGLEA